MLRSVDSGSRYRLENVDFFVLAGNPILDPQSTGSALASVGGGSHCRVVFKAPARLLWVCLVPLSSRELAMCGGSRTELGFPSFCCLLSGILPPHSLTCTSPFSWPAGQNVRFLKEFELPFPPHHCEVWDWCKARSAKGKKKSGN